MLDVLEVLLKEANRREELGKEHYMCKKLNESTLVHYHCLMCENSRWESVETLKELIVQEAEFQIVASEIIPGVNTASNSFKKKRNRRDSEKSTLFCRDQKTENHRKTVYMSCLCKVCNGQHGAWRCEKFKP